MSHTPRSLWTPILLLLLFLGGAIAVIPHTALSAGTFINQHETVVALLTEDWCDACKEFEPSFYGVETAVKAKYPSAQFIKVSLDNNSEAWKFYSARTLPHISFVHRGIPIGFSGELTQQKLEKWVSKKIVSKPIKLLPESSYFIIRALEVQTEEILHSIHLHRFGRSIRV